MLAKIEEMKTQRAMLWAQLREAVHNDDITSVLVTRSPDQSIDQIFKQELKKHQQLVSDNCSNFIFDKIMWSTVEIF